jgi:hypothetical protein
VELIRRLLRSRTVWLVLAIAGCWSLGRIAVRQLAKDPRFLARPDRIVMSAPAWGGEEVVRPVETRLRALGPLNLFDPRFGDRIRGALERVPGVRSVRSIHRHWPNRYSVDIVLRRPAALVVSGERTIPVTEDAVRLPEEPYRRAARGLVRIVGVESRPPAPGARWRSGRLADGLAALAQIGPHLREELAPLGISTIDVARADRPEDGVLLRGREDFVAWWGRPRARIGESPVERKIGYLRLAAQHPDQVWGRQIDVRFNQLLFRDPAVP